jgi:L-ascorbate metabolism protein UlaG (beta-lactamase superfamily)
MGKQFGGKLEQSHINTYARSEQWDGAKFTNLEMTEMNIPFRSMPKMIYNQLFKRKGLQPKQTIRSVPFNKTQFLSPAVQMKFAWFGHSALLLRINAQTILIDPMFGADAAPIAPFSIKRFNDVSTDLIDDLPEIDLMILSHDHYDHLDLKSVLKLKLKVKKYYVALGVARHLIEWGVPREDITEFDWWEAKIFSGIEITFTPSRHFSGRGMRDRFTGLWGGWVFKTQNENVWFSGDGGYGKHFKEIGERLGPFDLAFMECGQYNKLWPKIHMFPEECIRAALDTKAQKIMPVHWGSFTLSDHQWTDPVERFTTASRENSILFVTPRIGEIISWNENSEYHNWWEHCN